MLKVEKLDPGEEISLHPQIKITITMTSKTTISQCIKQIQQMRKFEASDMGNFWMGRCLAMAIPVLRMWEKLATTLPDRWLKLIASQADYKNLFALDILINLQEVNPNQSIQAYLKSLPRLGELKGKGTEIHDDDLENHGYLTMMIFHGKGVPEVLQKWVGEQLKIAKNNSLELNIPMAGAVNKAGIKTPTNNHKL